ncbi:DMT family transporter [Ammoniphilus sp. CFH 90114]|uniref:DMT family transporter n=1 Tax=Ammoniphilus sp. CFH 90114 TaxID=2493665 RepID=UPI00100DF41C|nr:DMT family transporter [Ammoniphilus sp. CFH 90114]RXT07223.1 DMT family transporter [Ammoniphilus sp. CFH 90114]
MGVLLSFFSALSFSANYVAVRRGVRERPERDAVIITNLINFIILGIISFIILMTMKPVEWSWLGLLFFALAGLFTSFLGRLALFGGIRRIGSARAVAVKNASPMVTIILAILIIQEDITLLPSLGILLIIIGLSFMIHQDWKKGEGNQEPQTNRIGILIALCAMFGFGLGQTFRKLGVVHMNEAIIGAWLGVATSLLLSFLMEIVRGSGKQLPSYFNPKNWNRYFFLAGVFSSLALIFFFSALRSIPIAYVSAISALEPILTVAITALFLKTDANKLTRKFYVTLGIIVFGVGLIAFK